MRNVKDLYSLTKPCPKCPFRTDVKPFLRRGRAKEIVVALDRGEFHCHQTTVPVEDDDGDEDLGAGPDTKHCAGALIMLEHAQRPSHAALLAERLGVYDRTKLDMEAPVFLSTQTFIDAQEGYAEQEHHETCHCCGPECEWPAGHMTGSAVVEGDAPPEALGHCPACGEFTCDSCFAENGKCISCEEWGD